MEKVHDKMHKSPLMVITWLVLTVGAAILLDGRLFVLFGLSTSLVVKVLIGYVIFWMHVVWFYGAYHLVSVAFSLAILAHRRKPEAVQKASVGQQDKVAVLYTTMNDFCLEAAASCLHQQYENFHVYLLDDSTLTEERAKVDQFHAAHPERTTVVRRKDRQGYKAGNINHALCHAAGDCTYFAVVDADEIIPPHFLEACVGELATDEHLGFVQANHAYWHPDDSPFAKDLSAGVDLHWKLFLTARNRYGFVLFYGHGAVLRKRVWDEIGGFPEMVSEDIAFATKARERGYYGKFLPDVVAREAFPRTYRQFQRREAKITKGTLEFALACLPSFLRARDVSWTEKFDLVATNMMLFLSLPFVLFLVMANVILPSILAIQATAGEAGLLSLEWLRIIQPLDTGLTALWSWDFYLITLLAILAPLAYQLPRFVTNPVRILRYVAQATTVYLSLCPTLCVAIGSFLRRRRVEFVSTGDRSASQKREGLPSFALILSILLTVFAIVIHHVALLTVSLSFLFVFILGSVGWTRRAVRVAAAVPILFFAIVFIATPWLLVGLSGFTVAVVPHHH